MPHPPQLSTSVASWTQTPAHTVWPVGHATQAPLSQISPLGHAVTDHWPSGAQVSVELFDSHCVAPGTHDPVHAPETQAWSSAVQEGPTLTHPPAEHCSGCWLLHWKVPDAHVAPESGLVPLHTYAVCSTSKPASVSTPIWISSPPLGHCVDPTGRGTTWTTCDAPAAPFAPVAPAGPCGPPGPSGPAGPVGPSGIVIWVHAPCVHAHSVFVALAYATAPLKIVVHGIGIQLFAMHEYRPEGEDTYAVSPAVAELHVERPETVLLWI
jgi:hypothetical protein